MIRYWLFVGLLFVSRMGLAQESPCSFAFHGYVFDLETKSPLPYVTVLIEGLIQGTTTDLKGYFEIENLCISEFNATFSFVGYKSSTHHHDSYHQAPVIFLAPDQLLLESVVVESTHEAADASVTKSVLSEKEIASLHSTNFGEVLSQLAGVGTLNTGQNISKPIIHGLSGNRILIINNGVRHEFQNWGVEHAPEIDPSQLDHVEVVKGAGTVRYGPEALGGVLLINPKDLELSHDLELSTKWVSHSNGRSLHPELALSQGFDHWAYSVEGSYTKQGDLRTPDYFLTNTGKQEYAYSGALRWHKRHFDLEARYSRFNQKLGILRGSVNGNLEDLVNAISSEPPPETRSFSYEIRQPFQWVDHQFFLLRASYLLENQAFYLTAGYQLNHRQEYDIRRGTTQLTPNIDLQLNTRSVDFNWVQPRVGNWQGEMGFQWQYQDNNNLPGTRTAQFVPNFNYNRIGLYSSGEWKLSNLIVEGGLRYDYHYTSARGIFQGDRYTNTLDFQNITAAIGLVKPLGAGTTLRFNSGSAWRPANVAEYYSFGRHQSVYEYGFWTYEFDEFNNPETAQAILTNQDRKIGVERGEKAILTIETAKGKSRMEVSSYANLIQNFIYTKPAGITNTVRGAFPYFIHDQTDALLWGVDAQGTFDHSASLSSAWSASYLWAKDLENQDFFIGLPPADLEYQMKYNIPQRRIDLLTVELGFMYAFRQFQSPRVITPRDILDAQNEGVNLFEADTRNFDFMSAPRGYLLPKMGLTVEQDQWQLQFKVHNLFNQSYRVYTDRLRYFADAKGRDFSISLGWRL